MLIPDKINRFNAYLGAVDEGHKLLGITAEVTLPTFTYMSETLSLAGAGGEIDSPSPGQLQSAQIEIPFTNISVEGMNLADDAQTLVLRSAQEFVDSANRARSFKNRTITISGFTKEINFGTLKKAGYGNPSITKEIVYYKDEVDGTTITEIDKLNGKFVINGVNKMEEIDKLI